MAAVDCASSPARARGSSMDGMLADFDDDKAVSNNQKKEWNGLSSPELVTASESDASRKSHHENTKPWSSYVIVPGSAANRPAQPILHATSTLTTGQPVSNALHWNSPNALHSSTSFLRPANARAYVSFIASIEVPNTGKHGTSH